MKRILFVLLFACLTPISAENNKDYCTKILVNDSTEISIYTESMFRIRISELSGEKFPAKYEIPFLIGKTSKWEKVDYIIEEKKNQTIISTNEIIISYSNQNGTFSVKERKSGRLVYPTDAPSYGMFKNGFSLFDNASFFNEKNQNSRFSHWFYNKETDNYTDVFLEDDLIYDQYFIYGPDYKSILKQFNLLVGAEPLLPIKAYGFFQTQHLACEGSQTKLLEVANEFRERKIPCDNLIIDFEWGDGCDGNKEIVWGSSMQWNKNYLLPLSPDKFIDSLNKLNYNVMLIHHNAPEFKSRKWQGWTETKVEEKEWFTNYYNELNIGIKGTWQDTRRNDLTDGLIWNNTQNYLGRNKRVLFMGCRRMQMINPWDDSFTVKPYNNMIGSRRYPFDWTGDCSYSWAELAWQINAITNEHGSMKGINYISSDGIGANWRIQARWQQFSAFSAIARSHNPKPWDGNVDIKDFVAKIQIEGRDTIKASTNKKIKADLETAEKSIQKYLNLRYQLLPYIYSYARESYDTGMPICRPMMLAYQNDFKCAMNQWPYQYLFGEQMLVAPVYGDLNTMEIYLPKGDRWIDYWSGEVFDGDGILRYDVSDINKLPLFVKAGSIIPMEQKKEWINEGEVPTKIFLDIYAGKDCKFDLYDDDRESIEYQNGEFGKTEIKFKEGDLNSELFISKMRGVFKNKPKRREYIIRVKNISGKYSTVKIFKENDTLLDELKLRNKNRTEIEFSTGKLQTEQNYKIIIN